MRPELEVFHADQGQASVVRDDQSAGDALALHLVGNEHIRAPDVVSERLGSNHSPDNVARVEADAHHQRLAGPRVLDLLDGLQHVHGNVHHRLGRFTSPGVLGAVLGVLNACRLGLVEHLSILVAPVAHDRGGVGLLAEQFHGRHRVAAVDALAMARVHVAHVLAGPLRVGMQPRAAPVSGLGGGRRQEMGPHRRQLGCVRRGGARRRVLERGGCVGLCSVGLLLQEMLHEGVSVGAHGAGDTAGAPAEALLAVRRGHHGPHRGPARAGREHAQLARGLAQAGLAWTRGRGQCLGFRRGGARVWKDALVLERHAGHHHVCVANRLDLEHLVLVGDRVQTAEELVEDVHHLLRRHRAGHLGEATDVAKEQRDVAECVARALLPLLDLVHERSWQHVVQNSVRAFRLLLRQHLQAKPAALVVGPSCGRQRPRDHADAGKESCRSGQRVAAGKVERVRCRDAERKGNDDEVGKECPQVVNCAAGRAERREEHDVEGDLRRVGLCRSEEAACDGEEQRNHGVAQGRRDAPDNLGSREAGCDEHAGRASHAQDPRPLRRPVVPQHPENGEEAEDEAGCPHVRQLTPPPFHLVGSLHLLVPEDVQPVNNAEAGFAPAALSLGLGASGHGAVLTGAGGLCIGGARRVDVLQMGFAGARQIAGRIELPLRDCHALDAHGQGGPRGRALRKLAR
mmetsp:Transcript_22570/g.85513  ORF Transcript_22570/g.85513 Transcript_22570/m.85513 type:complete len:685 (-) Transcript_22570:6944-8998(-)